LCRTFTAPLPPLLNTQLTVEDWIRRYYKLIRS
jgi:hypothetical protein